MLYDFIILLLLFFNDLSCHVFYALLVKINMFPQLQISCYHEY